jgi:hypothetical protein
MKPLILSLALLAPLPAYPSQEPDFTGAATLAGTAITACAIGAPIPACAAVGLGVFVVVSLTTTVERK